MGDTWNEAFRQADLNPKDYKLFVNHIHRTDLNEMIPFDLLRDIYQGDVATEFLLA